MQACRAATGSDRRLLPAPPAAGELGCRASGPGRQSLRHQPQELLALAKANLDRFCVVMVHERLEESVAYLHHVTGWAQVGGGGSLGKGPGLGLARLVLAAAAHAAPVTLVRVAMLRSPAISGC